MGDNDGDTGFDPTSFADLKNEDETPFFSEEQAGRLKGFEKFKGVNGEARLVKAHMDLEGMRGIADKTLSELKADRETYEKEVGAKYEKHLAPLKEDATDEEKVAHQLAVKKFLGAPEKVEDYKFDDDSLDEDSITALKQLAHDNHWTQEATDKAVDIQKALIAKQEEAFNEVQKEKALATQKILVKTFGGKEAYVEKCENIMRMLRPFVNPDWRNFEESMDEPWQEFKKDVYASGIANNDVLMTILGEAIDKGVGRVEGKTHVEMHGSVPVQGDGSWEEEYPGVPEP